MATHIILDCTSYVNSANAAKYKIEAQVDQVDTGDLPFSEIFVHTIVDFTDPKADTFKRVANITDLNGVTRGRDAANSAGQTDYLRSSVTLEYDSVLVATEVKNTLLARVDTLITEWITYNTKFLAPTGSDFPLEDTSITVAAVETYKTALATKDAKETSVAAATVALNSASTAVATAQTSLTEKTADSVLCAQLMSLLGAAVAGEAAFRTATDTFLVQCSTFYASADPASASAITFAAQLVTEQTAATAEKQNCQGNLAQLQTQLTTACATKTAAVTTAAAAKVAADTSYAAARTTLAAAEAELAAAVTAVDSALAAVLSVCPSFDPSTV